MVWQKGQSGNPGGRSKVVAEVRKLAQEHSAEAIATLVHLMRNGKSDHTRRAAANDLLDRGIGKPIQAVDATVRDDRPPSELTTAELMRIAAQGLEKETEGAEH